MSKAPPLAHPKRTKVRLRDVVALLNLVLQPGRSKLYVKLVDKEYLRVHQADHLVDLNWRGLRPSSAL